MKHSTDIAGAIASLKLGVPPHIVSNYYNIKIEVRGETVSTLKSNVRQLKLQRVG